MRGRNRRSNLAKFSPLAFVVAAAALMVAPSGASAATTIGETFEPTTLCDGAMLTRLQSVSPGGQYSAPSDGVITRWSFEAGADPPDLRFKAARAAPGADLTTSADFTIVGESLLETDLDDNELNSFFTRIPVLAGDVIGFFNATISSGDGCGTGDAAYDTHFFFGDPHPGDTETFTLQSAVKYDVSALLEPDCDKDGLGDETQDGNLSSCPGAPQPLTCRGERLTISGTPLNDTITGTNDRDVIAALGGNDEVIALDGNDVVCGNDGDDKLRGQDGNDRMKGNRGADRVKGGTSDDFLKGNRGQDILKGKAGDDTLNGGRNDDTCRGGAGDNKIRNCES